MAELFQNVDCIELYVPDLEEGHYKTDKDGNVTGVVRE